jgi:hypothetical protein
MTASKKHPLLAWLTAALLLLAEAGLFTHALDHELQDADRPCAVCLHADHLTALPSAGQMVSPPAVPLIQVPAPALGIPLAREASPYAPRAPPVSS